MPQSIVQVDLPGAQSEFKNTLKSRNGATMESRLTFEQLMPGQTWISPSRTVTETDVVNFANITGDQNPLHIDHEFARSTPYRRPIAHGLLGLSWVAGLGSQSPSVETVAFISIRQWEFCRPIFFGDTVHVRTTVLEKQADARRNGRVHWRLELLNQQGEVTQQGVFETLVKVGNKVQGPSGRPHFNISLPHNASPAEVLRNANRNEPDGH